MLDRSASTIEILTSIWQRLFECKSIRADEDFFDLGGNASLAVRLSSEIEAKFGQTLFPAAIGAAPTITALAALLQMRRVQGPLVQLNPGTEGPTIFMTHGIGSSVIDLVPIARKMQLSQPIFGMEASGNYVGEEPLDRVEDMAQFFLAALRQMQPHGPYFLIGYSLGGLVTLEMARRLQAEREKVALLAMLDSYPDRHQLSFAQHARLAFQLAKLRLTNKQPGEHPSGSGVGHQIPGKRSIPAEANETIFIAMQRAKEAQYRALRNYRPRFYDGKVKFVRAAVISYFPPDPAPIWSPLVKELEVETVPGDHVGMLTTHVETSASVVARYVRQALLTA
jgi:thioesterase domain-containing protein